MAKKTASVGNKGESIRSDCFVRLELVDSGGVEIELISKVERFFGDSIRELCKKELEFFGIKHAKMQIQDQSALPFVITARIEAAVHRCVDITKEYLSEMIPENMYHTEPDRSRRSRLYLPGNSPKFMVNAGLHKPDGIILDLEDAVSPDKKYEARFIVRNALRQVNFYGAERMVRINQIPRGLDDLPYIVPHNIHVILVPKCEYAHQVKQVEEKITSICKVHDIKHSVFLMPIIESSLGVVNAYEIAKASENVVALVIGLEDYTADIGAQRTKKGKESFFARCQLVNAAKAAGIQAIDSVFSDVSDMNALAKVVQESKSLGFDGMGCIHPRQIKVIHENYAPDDKEIEKAKKIVRAFYDAQEKGLGVVSLGAKMIDAPVVKRAQKTIDIAIKTGKISQSWRNTQ